MPKGSDRKCDILKFPWHSGVTCSRSPCLQDLPQNVTLRSCEIVAFRREVFRGSLIDLLAVSLGFAAKCFDCEAVAVKRGVWS